MEPLRPSLLGIDCRNLSLNRISQSLFDRAKKLTTHTERHRGGFQELKK
jgi:hypothetical protein